MALGDAKLGETDEASHNPPPTLRQAGDAEPPVNAAGRVQFPTQKQSAYGLTHSRQRASGNAVDRAVV